MARKALSQHLLITESYGLETTECNVVPVADIHKFGVDAVLMLQIITATS